MDNLLNQGLELAMYGMGTVFVFLALLIAATRTMSALVLKFQPALAEIWIIYMRAFVTIPRAYSAITA